MQARKVFGHVAITVCALLILAGLPILTHFDFTASGQDPDAVSGASIVLPDLPSGDFLVLVNTAKHTDTMQDWTRFFRGEDFPVIFEDIRCIVAKGDAAGQQMAERLQAQLPENQMTLRTENPTLLVSKAEAGYIDVAIFSNEMAAALQLSPDPGQVTVIRVQGEAQ